MLFFGDFDIVIFEVVKNATLPALCLVVGFWLARGSSRSAAPQLSRTAVHGRPPPARAPGPATRPYDDKAGRLGACAAAQARQPAG
jgi:hypothetical protein